MPSPATLVNWIKRGLDIPAERAAQLAERTVPALSIGSVSNWWENDGLVERPACGWVNSNAVSSEYSHLALYNPAVNGANVLLERFQGFSSAGMDYEVLYTTTALVDAESPSESASLKMFRDGRQVDPTGGGPNDRPSAKLYYWSNVGQIDGYRGWKGRYISLEQPLVPFPFLLPPGRALCIAGLTLNVSLFAHAFQWREIRIPR